jgi:Iron-sulfur cluster-binding domain
VNHVAAVISMLHESAEMNSALRKFRGVPVLQWTLSRLGRAEDIDSVSILCWDDQHTAAAAVAENVGVAVLSKGPRQMLGGMEAISAARRWADGWRGGLLGTCEFDLGFHSQWTAEIASAGDLNADAVLLVDPAAGLIDAVLIGRLIEHAQAHPAAELCFTQAAVGLNAVLLRRSLVDRLTVARIHPGRLLTYWPDQHGVDPTGKDSCAPTPTTVARSAYRFKLDSHRQILRADHATVCFNGQLISTEAQELVHRMRGCESVDVLPRDIVLEINTNRLTKPVFGASGHLKISRPGMSVEMAKKLFSELGRLDDIRLTIAGVGDPLLSPVFFDVVAAARSEGIAAINVETDLMGVDAMRLCAAGIDVVSVHLPAATPGIYARLMGVDGMARVMENIRLLEQELRRSGRGTPLIAPIFTKMAINLAEMDVWFDYWLRRLGHAVIVGPSDLAGQIPDCALADMAPPQRKACGRILTRMSVLSDGSIVSCEEDVMGKQVMGVVGETPIQEVWRNRFAGLRKCHEKAEWGEQPLCKGCREWHRP